LGTPAGVRNKELTAGQRRKTVKVGP
jgi:hypothetical protein